MQSGFPTEGITRTDASLREGLITGAFRDLPALMDTCRANAQAHVTQETCEDALLVMQISLTFLMRY